MPLLIVHHLSISCNPVNKGRTKQLEFYDEMCKSLWKIHFENIKL